MIDTSKVIHAPVGGGRYTVTAPIVKEDYGLYLLIEGLELPSTYEVDFSNSEHNGTSVTMIGNSDGVLIPSQFIASGKDVFAFLYHVGADYGRTIYKFRIPNKLRPDRTDETPTPEEQSVIDQAIAALNDAVEQTAQAVVDAEESAQASAESAQASGESALSASNSALSAGEYASNALSHAESASASATASAQSAEQSAINSADAQDSAEEAQDYASASAQSATASANSASQASGYATSASQSASSAQGYASQAQASANTASTKASEASTSASTASTKATESAQSATNAQTYATQAENAKTASQTAQGLAESARDSAISAKESAEDARDEAQSIVDGISGKVEQIDSNTERIESLEDDRYKPYAVDSASGAIASFTDGADDIPLKSLVVDINPVQDLHGYDSPWVAGGGKNVFDQTLMRDRGAWYNIAVNVKPDTKYTMSTDKQSGALYLYFNNTNTQGGGNSTAVYSGHPVTVTSTSDGYVYVSQRRASSEDSFQNYNYQIEEGDTATDYAPYENICPISGWTGANVWADGKNLLDPTLMKDQVAWNTIKIYAPVGTRLTMSTNSPSALTTGGLPCYFKRHGEGNGSSTIVASYHSVTKIVPNEGYVEINQRNPDGTLSFDDFEWQIEIGITATDYEPYQGQTIPINWQTEAGTVYGGSLDVLTGKLTVYPYYASYNGETLTGRWISDRDVYASGTTPTIGAQVVNIGAQGTEIQLDAHTVNSLYGQNNIFADTGDTACEYRADTKLYIEKLTQPEEDDMVADSAITSGQFFMIGNTLYRALADIASGAIITVGTNAQRVSLADALNLVNA